jgi:hypothetical protein
VNQLLANPLSELISGGQIQVPAQVKEMMEEGLGRARTAWGTACATVKDAADAQSSATKTIGDHLARSMTVNVNAAFDAAQALTKARTLAQAQSIQVDFIQDHMSRMMEQSRQWIDLNAKIGQELAAAVSEMASAAAKTTRG